MSDNQQISEAAKALYQAALAKAEAKTAQQKAKAAVAALAPEPATVVLGTGKQEPFPECPRDLQGADRKQWFAALNVFSEETSKYSPDGYLQQLVASQFADPSEKEIAMKELNRRGFLHHPASKTWSRSHRA